MYRRQGSIGALQGVLSGPYTGGRRRVDAAKLAPSMRRRLADVLAGRAEPAPILYERPAGATMRFRAAWGLVVALVALLVAFTTGFGDPTSPRAIQPAIWLVPYGGAALLLAVSVLARLRRRARVGADALAPGRYLLALDVVEVPPVDREGRQVIVVKPLGDARDASVRTDRGRPELVVLFDGGEQAAFPLRADPEGELALRRLERTQHLLEELTYGNDLARTVALDPFFEVRVDASWDAVAPAGAEGAGASAGVARAFVEGNAASIAAMVAAAALACGALATRNHLSDRALFLRALRGGTPEAFDAYLARGHAYRADATALRDRLLHARDEAAKRAAAQSRDRDRFGGGRPESALGDDERRARATSAEGCLAALRAHASPMHPKALRAMQEFVDRARATGDNIIPVAFTRRVADPPPGTVVWSGFEASLASHERVLLWALERVFSETCPAALVRFAPAAASATAARGGDVWPGLDVTYDVTWPKTSPASLPVAAPSIAFHVRLRGPTMLGWSHDVEWFDLTLAPPATMPTDVRDRSLFLVPLATGAAGADPTPRAYELLTARAFDRLYDEIWSVLFEGDPRVPLREPTE